MLTTTSRISYRRSRGEASTASTRSGRTTRLTAVPFSTTKVRLASCPLCRIKSRIYVLHLKHARRLITDLLLVVDEWVEINPSNICFSLRTSIFTLPHGTMLALKDVSIRMFSDVRWFGFLPPVFDPYYWFAG